MTRYFLIEELKKFCEKETKHLEYPTAVQKGDTKRVKRAPKVYKMRLPNARDYKKYEPYIIIQLADSEHIQPEGSPPKHSATIRFIFCVTHEDESEGAMLLLNLMDIIQMELLKSVRIGPHFCLDVHQPLSTLIYPDDTAPYYAGEMVGTFKLTAIQPEVNFEF